MREVAKIPEFWGLLLGIFLAAYAFLLSRSLPFELNQGASLSSFGWEKLKSANLYTELISDPQVEANPFFFLQLQRTLYFDLGFIFAYMAFLAFTGYYAGKKFGKVYERKMVFLLGFLGIAGCSDGIENHFLLSLCQPDFNTENNEIFELISSLTQFKWFFLCIAGIWISSYLWLYESGIFFKMAAIAFFCSFLIFFASLLQSHFLQKATIAFAIACLLVMIQFFFSLAFRSLSKNT